MSAIILAEEYAQSPLSPWQVIAKLGEGWVAEEALAISIFCALRARSFRQGVIMAVNHDGDSDSTGSITGNLLGAMYGHKTIPTEWLNNLELMEVIAEVAEDLYYCTGWDIGKDSADEIQKERIFAKYPF